MTEERARRAAEEIGNRRERGRPRTGRRPGGASARGAGFGVACGLAAALLLPAGVHAESVRFGLRAGYADLEGEILGGAIRTGEERLFGLHVIFPLIADQVQIQIAGEGTTDELDLDRSGLGSALGDEVEWSDLALYTSLRLELAPSAPLGFYVGAGVGAHFTEISEEELREVLEETGKSIESGLEGEQTDLEWHGVGGISLGLGQTLELFGEGRYRRVEGDFERDGWAGYAGLNVRLP